MPILKEFQPRNFSLKSFRITLPSILTALIIIINLILISLPLTNILGFEFSIVNSLLLFLVGGLLVIWNNKKNDEVRKNILYQLISLKKYLILFSIIPLTIGTLSTLFFSICPIKEGFLFYFVITIPSLFFGLITAKFIIVLFRKFRFLFFVLTYLLILSVPIIEFYFNPQIYFYNPIFGFISGTIYDEDISLNNILISYRLFNIAFFIGLAFLSELMDKGKKFYKWKSLLIVLICLIIFYLLKPTLHFSSTFNSLTKKLGKSLKTKHSIIYYSKAIKNPKEIELIGLLHDYYYEAVMNELKLRNKSKIISFIFADENEKRFLFGSGKADVAKPWLNQIYLNYPTLRETLKHELTHLLAKEFGATPFKIASRLNLAITEGLAMAIENNFDNYPVHYMAKLAFNSGYKIQVKKLFSGINFFSQYSSVSYIYAGSFIRFLIDKYGVNKIKEFYKSANFENVYNIPFNQIEKEYYEYLDSLTLQLNKNKAQLYFGVKPIFKKFCPRLAAYETKEAWRYYKEKKFKDAEKLFIRIYKYSNSYESLLGLINCYIRLNKNSIAENLLSKEIIKFKQSSYYFNLELILSDIYIKNNKLEQAKKLYDSLLTQNPHIEFVNQVLIRKKILEMGADSLISFLNLEPKNKIKVLLNLNKSEIQYYTITQMLNLYDDTNELKSIIEFFSNKVEVDDYSSSYAVLKLSEAGLNIGEFELAKELVIKALRFNQDTFFHEVLIENLRLINWLNNFANDTRSHYKFENVQ